MATASPTRTKMRIRKGDTVQVIAGKDKGKTGEVLRTLPWENRVVVQGVNLRTRHVKPAQATPSHSKPAQTTSSHSMPCRACQSHSMWARYAHECYDLLH